MTEISYKAKKLLKFLNYRNLKIGFKKMVI